MKDLNLIPKSYLRAKAKKVKRIYRVIVIFAAVLILAASIALPLGRRFKLEWDKNNIVKQVNETSGYVEKEKELKIIKDQYAEREKEAGELIKSGADVITILNKIEKASPQNFFIQSLNVMESGNQSDIVQVTINCISKTEDDVASFVNYLRSDSYFENVVLNSIKKMTVQIPLPSAVPTPKQTAKKTVAVTPVPTPVKSINLVSDTRYNSNITLSLKRK